MRRLYVLTLAAALAGGAGIALTDAHDAVPQTGTPRYLPHGGLAGLTVTASPAYRGYQPHGGLAGPSRLGSR